MLSPIKDNTMKVMSCFARCLASSCSVTATHVCEIQPTLWSILTVILILYTAGAVFTVTANCKDYVHTWHKPIEACDGEGPILLSRALTTDPFRGITIFAAFASAFFYAQTPSTSPVKTPIVGVLIMIGVAFIVSMFETDAHFYIINITSLVALACTCPIWHGVHDAWVRMKWTDDPTPDEWDTFLTDAREEACFKQDLLWWVCWVATVCVAALTAVLLEIIDDVRSWVYVVEYIFFWMLFWLLSWTIREAEREQKAPAQLAQPATRLVLNY